MPRFEEQLTSTVSAEKLREFGDHIDPKLRRGIDKGQRQRRKGVMSNVVEPSCVCSLYGMQDES